ncbi:MAG TPA: hypothetical protein GX707_07820, partial [Epulopiscium sp.]|nr:hypothetical protein [Candidatus Epulonipiscium sp.]
TYYSELNIEPIDLEVEFIDDLYKRRLELAIDENDKNNVKKNKQFISMLNGTLVLPATAYEKPHILISNNAVDDDALFVGTIIHELTHIHDYYDFAKHNGIEDLKAIQGMPNFSGLYFWSEFHARRTGYYFYRKIYKSFVNDSLSTEDEIKHIKKTECPFQFDYLKNELSKNENNPTQFLYSIMQFLGRYSVWQDLFPEVFNKGTLPGELVASFDNRITDIYDFLYNNSTFDDIKDKLNELKTKLDLFVSLVE